MKDINRTVNGHNEVVFAEETPEGSFGKALEPWKLMIVDDEKAVHSMTRQVLEDFSFEHRSLISLNAYSGKMDNFRIYNYPLTHSEIVYLAGKSSVYQPLLSEAELYSGEPALSKRVNFRDFALLAQNWLDENLWP